MAETKRAEPKRNIRLALFLGWMLPGLGHLYVGRRAYGLLYFLVIAGLYVGGMLLSRGTAVNFAVHEVYFVCQLLAGPATLSLEFLRPRELDLGGSLDVLDHQTGVVYVAVAGVLNLITLCELHRRHENPEAMGPADTLRARAVGDEGDTPLGAAKKEPA